MPLLPLLKIEAGFFLLWLNWRRNGMNCRCCPLLCREWQELPEGSSSWKERGELVRAMVMTGMGEPRLQVLAWLKRRAADLVLLDPEREDDLHGLVLLDNTLGILVESGDRDVLQQVLAVMSDTLGAARDDLLRRSTSGEEERNIHGMSSADLFVGALTSLPRNEAAHRALHDAWKALRQERHQEHLMPWSFWSTWVRHLVRFPRGGLPIPFVAEQILRSGGPGEGPPALMLACAGKGLREWNTTALAQLYLGGWPLRCWRDPDRGQVADDVVLNTMLGEGEQQGGFFKACRARLILGENVQPTDYRHRHHDEEMSLLLEVAGDPGASWQRTFAARSLAPGFWEERRLRVLLDSGAYRDLRQAAQLAAQRADVFGSSFRLGYRRIFMCYEASALWNMNQRHGARELLRRAGANSPAQIQGPGADDFPGLTF